MKKIVIRSNQLKTLYPEEKEVLTGIMELGIIQYQWNQIYKGMNQMQDAESLLTDINNLIVPLNLTNTNLIEMLKLLANLADHVNQFYIEQLIQSLENPHLYQVYNPRTPKKFWHLQPNTTYKLKKTLAQDKEEIYEVTVENEMYCRMKKLGGYCYEVLKYGYGRDNRVATVVKKLLGNFSLDRNRQHPLTFKKYGIDTMNSYDIHIPNDYKALNHDEGMQMVESPDVKLVESNNTIFITKQVPKKTSKIPKNENHVIDNQESILTDLQAIRTQLDGILMLKEQLDDKTTQFTRNLILKIDRVLNKHAKHTKELPTKLQKRLPEIIQETASFYWLFFRSNLKLTALQTYQKELFETLLAYQNNTNTLWNQFWSRRSYSHKRIKDIYDLSLLICKATDKEKLTQSINEKLTTMSSGLLKSSIAQCISDHSPILKPIV